MPKILIGVSSSFCANFLKGQVNFLVEKGFDVVIVSGPGEEISMLAKAEHARLITIPFTKRISPFRDFIQLLRIISILKRENPDIINAGNPKSAFLILLAAWFTHRKNRIFTLHGLLSDTKKGWVRRIITLTEKISCNIAHKVIVVSPSLKTHAEDRKILKAGKGTVIEKGSCNGIDLGVFARNDIVMSKADALKKEWNIKESDFVIGFIGRLSKDKGVDLLVKSYNILVKKYPQIRLVVVGPVIEENPVSGDILRQLYQDPGIIYPGKLYDVAPVYGLLDVFVLPSLREGFPNVLIEASAMHVPAVASDIPGCRDAIWNGHTGELFPAGDFLILTEKLEQLLLNRAKGEAYGANGFLYVKENFRSEKIWNEILTLYKRMEPKINIS